MAQLLLIDDDPVFLKLIAAQLGALGHQVTTAEHGGQGLALLDAQPDGYDIVITDLTMPEVDGRAVVRTIRRRRDLSRLPVIIVSATTDAEGLDDLIRDGNTRFMGKPVDFFGLSSIIGRLCNRRTTAEIVLTPEQLAALSQAQPRSRPA